MECVAHCRPKARKVHRCYWCGEEITVGETYVQWTCLGDGGPHRVRCHDECDTVWVAAARHDQYYREEVSFGDHARGCLCQHGWCQCAKLPVTSDQ